MNVKSKVLPYMRHLELLTEEGVVLCMEKYLGRHLNVQQGMYLESRKWRKDQYLDMLLDSEQCFKENYYSSEKPNTHESWRVN